MKALNALSRTFSNLTGRIEHAVSEGALNMTDVLEQAIQDARYPFRRAKIQMMLANARSAHGVAGVEALSVLKANTSAPLRRILGMDFFEERGLTGTRHAEAAIAEYKESQRSDTTMSAAYHLHEAALHMVHARASMDVAAFDVFNQSWGDRIAKREAQVGKRVDFASLPPVFA